MRERTSQTGSLDCMKRTIMCMRSKTLSLSPCYDGSDDSILFTRNFKAVWIQKKVKKGRGCQGRRRREEGRMFSSKKLVIRQLFISSLFPCFSLVLLVTHSYCSPCLVSKTWQAFLLSFHENREQTGKWKYSGSVLFSTKREHRS